MALFSEQADVSVRPAVAGDELAITDIQLAAWRSAHTPEIGQEVLAGLDGGAIAERWAQAITAPPGPGYRVLVACEGPDVVGFTAIAPLPAPEESPLAAPGGEILSLEVAPVAQRSGHGSRLLAAAVDTLREDGAAYARTWVLDGDAGRAQFLSSAGFGPEEAVRELATGIGPDGQDRTVTEHLWGASI